MLNISLILALLAGSPQVNTEETNQTIVTINEDAITEQQIRAFFRRQAPVSGLHLNDPQAQTQLFGLFVDRELLYHEGIAQGIDKDPEVMLAIEEQRRQEIAKAMIERYSREHPITEEKIKKYYDEEFAPPRSFELRIAHIQVDSEEAAQAILEKLKKGEDFGALVKESSKDNVSNPDGDLGWHSLQGLPAGFGEALSKLEPGQYSRPIQSDVGWHIVKVMAKRPIAPPPFESVKSEIFQHLQNESIARYINELKKKADIELK